MTTINDHNDDDINFFYLFFYWPIFFLWTTFFWLVIFFILPIFFWLANDDINDQVDERNYDNNNNDDDDVENNDDDNGNAGHNQTIHVQCLAQFQPTTNKTTVRMMIMKIIVHMIQQWVFA